MTTFSLQELKEMYTPERLQRMEAVLNERTRHFCFVLEDIRRPQNTSAVLRSSDAFGFQDVHIIENEHPFSYYPLVTRGAEQWLTVNQYNALSNNTESCLTQLKEQGYKLVATGLTHPDYPLDKMPVDHQKTAILIGTEASGLSKQALAMADEVVHIPMYGFTQSFNLSVTAAMMMQYIRPALQQLDFAWKLSETEKNEILKRWLMEKLSANEPR